MAFKDISKKYPQVVGTADWYEDEVETWKTKYLEARKSGYLEGLEEAALIAEKVAHDCLATLVFASASAADAIKPEDTVAWQAAQLIRARMAGE